MNHIHEFEKNIHRCRFPKINKYDEARSGGVCILFITLINKMQFFMKEM